MVKSLTAKELRDRRVELGMSLDEVCIALGMPGNASELSRWERGARKSIPGNASTKDYERVLDGFERASKKAGAGK